MYTLASDNNAMMINCGLRHTEYLAACVPPSRLQAGDKINITPRDIQGSKCLVAAKGRVALPDMQLRGLCFYE